MAEYYGQRATPGGLIIAEATVVSETGFGYPNTPGERVQLGSVLAWGSPSAFSAQQLPSSQARLRCTMVGPCTVCRPTATCATTLPAGIFEQAHVEGWRPVTEAVHSKGGFMFSQLWHVGRVSHPHYQPGEALPVSSSAVPITFDGQPGQLFSTKTMQVSWGLARVWISWAGCCGRAAEVHM